MQKFIKRLEILFYEERTYSKVSLRSARKLKLQMITDKNFDFFFCLLRDRKFLLFLRRRKWLQLEVRQDQNYHSRVNPIKIKNYVNLQKRITFPQVRLTVY